MSFFLTDLTIKMSDATQIAEESDVNNQGVIKNTLFSDTDTTGTFSYHSSSNSTDGVTEILLAKSRRKESRQSLLNKNEVLNANNDRLKNYLLDNTSDKILRITAASFFLFFSMMLTSA